MNCVTYGQYNDLKIQIKYYFLTKYPYPVQGIHIQQNEVELAHIDKSLI